MTEYQGYPEYKDSGVEWLGQIPSTWEVSQIRRVAECCDYLRIPVNSGDRMDMKGDIPYWGANSIQGYVNKALVDFPAILVGEDGAPFMDKSKEVSFAIDYPFWPNNHVHVLKAKTGVNYEYISRALNVVDYSSYIKGSTRQKLNQGDLMGIRIPLPSLEIQHQIVKFLDRETAHIDAGIANMESLIALLTEKRASLISETVTRGIPGEHTEFKDSCVEWLGEIPAGWETPTISKIAKVMSSSVDKKEYEGEIPIQLCNYTDVYYKNEITSDIPFMKATANTNQINSFAVKEGDVPLTKDSETADDIGIASYVPETLPGVVYGYHLSIIRPHNSDSGKFIKYVLDSKYWKTLMEIGAKGITRVSIKRSVITAAVIPFPPIEIQQEIIGFLDKETAQIDLAISHAKSLIPLLKEKRQTLISDVVTGKIDVRNNAN